MCHFLPVYHLGIAFLGRGVGQNITKCPGLVSGRSILLVSKVTPGRFFWRVCVIPRYNSHVILFGIRAVIHVKIWLRNRMRMVLWRKEQQGNGHDACSFDLFLLDLLCLNCSPQCDLFPDMQKIGTENGIVFSFPFLEAFKFSTHVLQQTWERMAYSDQQFCLQSNRERPSSESQLFWLDGLKEPHYRRCKEPVRIIRALVSYSYRNLNMKQEREK